MDVSAHRQECTVPLGPARVGKSPTAKKSARVYLYFAICLFVLSGIAWIALSGDIGENRERSAILSEIERVSNSADARQQIAAFSRARGVAIE